MDRLTIERARLGDVEARAVLIRGLQDVWYRFCLSQLGQVEPARDAAQETALRFLRQLSGFRGDSQIRTWSLGIAVNVVREHRRRRQDDPRELSLRIPVAGAATDAPIRSAQSTEESAALQAAIQALPERQREAVFLRFFEELSVEETARAMNCAQGTVKATVHQALRSMKLKLKQLN